MWMLYAVMSMLCAGVVIKIVAPIVDKGRVRHGRGVSAADRTLAMALMCAVPAVSLSVYLVLGRPDLPSTLALFKDVQGMLARQDALLAQEPLQVLLKKNPDNLPALLKLGAVNDRLGHYDEALKFYKRAVLVAGMKGDILLRLYMEELGQVQVRANKGIVGKDARATFETILKLKAEDPVAGYYLALAKAQSGDVKGAIDDWMKMLSTGTPLAYWKWDVRAAIAAAKAGLYDKKTKPQGAAP